jgi:iron(III) transport system substrate-binding protein
MRVTGRISLSLAVLLLVGLLMGACSSGDENTITVYSGRTSSLMQPLLEQFATDTGVVIKVRYGSTAGTVALLLEEGGASPADVVLLQDAGALGALAKEGLLAQLPDDLLKRVDRKFRSTKGEWVGVSGRVRTIVYNTKTIDPDRDLPESVVDFVAPEWKGRLGWAPTNGSFQAFVTALRVLEGDAVAKDWLEGIKANSPVDYPNNTSIVDAVGRGAIDAGFVNHYYLHRFLTEQGPEFGARNHYSTGDAGALINVSGVGILASSEATAPAHQLVEYLLSETAQRYFAEQTTEYPLIEGVEPIGEIPPLAILDPPDIDLSKLDDLRGTLDLMREAGVIP